MYSIKFLAFKHYRTAISCTIDYIMARMFKEDEEEEVYLLLLKDLYILLYIVRFKVHVYHRTKCVLEVMCVDRSA